MSIPIIPESAPFSSEQRAWLNGFFAGVLGLGTPTAVSNGSGTAVLEAQPAEEESFPWHDASLNLDERLQLAQDRPYSRKLMACMAQLNCGACGYLCQSYSEAIANGQEKDLTRCAPGGSDTAKALKKLVKEQSELAGHNGAAQLNGIAAVSPVVNNKENLAARQGYSRQSPVMARLKSSLRLTSGESPKDTRHVVLDIADCGLEYEAGDSLGICPVNDREIVEEILPFVEQNADQDSLRNALLHDRQISRLSDDIMEKLAPFARKESEYVAMRTMAEEDAEGFLSVANLYDLFERFPSCRPTSEALISALKPLQPRLYSISSSPKKAPGEVHLTVGVVRFESFGKTRYGVASHFLGIRSLPDDPVRAFVQSSKFRLPTDDNIPIIMVGPGTGIAPFRAFLQERAARNASGKNWLFFGNQFSQYDFLYGDELKQWSSDGVLTHLSTAFSRETSQKIYVQDRMREQGVEIWSWLKSGAHFYVCGDAKRMAKDVDEALQEIISEHGGLSADAAKAYTTELVKSRRYQKDVY